ncbi:hypothetical protein PUN47_20955 [Vibrio fluvialis]|uniref:hypothetical protein n=1 Tax=Vibrio fluvialis TaxID=676 RepID=UPI00237FF96F|nr:hypothetical protein [Vibrio fluvialis]WDY54322.1 hypothetical protein PUN47_20955 [Vibrio fluvialis]
MKAKFLALVLVVTLSPFSNATEWLVTSVSSWKEGSVVVAAIDKEVEDFSVGVVEASRNRNGKLSMFFTYVGGKKDLCSFKSHILATDNEQVMDSVIVHYFNSQPIRMVGFCRKDGEKFFPYYVPETEQGLSYIVNEFKKSKEVIVETNLEGEFHSVRFPAEGFSQYWNSKDIKAL